MELKCEKDTHMSGLILKTLVTGDPVPKKCLWRGNMARERLTCFLLMWV